PFRSWSEFAGGLPLVVVWLLLLCLGLDQGSTGGHKRQGDRHPIGGGRAERTRLERGRELHCTLGVLSAEETGDSSPESGSKSGGSVLCVGVLSSASGVAT